MKIRKIDHKEIKEVRELIITVFMKFEAPDYSEEGVRAFFDTVLNNPGYMNSLAIYGAYINDALVGVIATRNEGKHIALFFVDGEYHRQGIGRKLFQTALENTTSAELTVNSSPFAKEVYHHLGFEDTDVEQSVTGIRFTPMIYRR